MVPCLGADPPPPLGRLKAGLKLQEESEKREVQQGIHLLQDPEGEAHSQLYILLCTVYSHLSV